MATYEKAGIFVLPNEIVALIFDELDPRSLVVCRQVCQFFSKTSRDTRLEYKIELFLAGMQDGPSSDLSPSERLRMLEAHQKAWRELEWTETDHLDLQGDTWEFYRGVLGVSAGRSFSFKQMPSKLRGIPGREWKFESPTPCRDFTMDPDQDLMIILDVSEGPVLRLYSLKSGNLHPLAQSQYIPIQGADSVFEDPNIKVYGQYIGIMRSSLDNAPELRIYNWITGELQMHLPVGRGEMRCFAFMPDDLVMVACCLGPATASLRIFPLKAGVARKPLCSLYLPPCGYKVLLLDLTLSTDPISESPSGEFSLAPVDTLYTVTFNAWSGPERSRQAMFFIPLSTVLKHTDSASDAFAKKVPWEKWGPGGTHCIKSGRNLADVWVCHTAGMKSVVAKLSAREGKASTVCVYDFFTKRSHRDDEALRKLPEPILASAFLFASRIDTHLPCNMLESDLACFNKDKIKAAMMSDDGIVLVSENVVRLFMYSF